jgi:hypothetical protein
MTSVTYRHCDGTPSCSQSCIAHVSFYNVIIHPTIIYNDADRGCGAVYEQGAERKKEK